MLFSFKLIIYVYFVVYLFKYFVLIVYINQLLPINLKSTKIIEYDEQYVFGFVEIEYNDDIHPLNGCFLKPFDLSINLLIKLK